MYAESLPGKRPSPGYPFTSIVININIACEAHRDSDMVMCVAIPFKQFTGGELVLVEAGLVLQVEAGDLVVFPSTDLTHFNLHYRGERGSIILHSDATGEGWVKNRNGWSHSKYMR